MTDTHLSRTLTWNGHSHVTDTQQGRHSPKTDTHLGRTFTCDGHSFGKDTHLTQTLTCDGHGKRATVEVACLVDGLVFDIVHALVEAPSDGRRGAVDRHRLVDTPEQTKLYLGTLLQNPFPNFGTSTHSWNCIYYRVLHGTYYMIILKGCEYPNKQSHSVANRLYVRKHLCLRFVVSGSCESSVAPSKNAIPDHLNLTQRWHLLLNKQQVLS